MLLAPATSFVGRTLELARLAQARDRGERLVTLLGPGGIGKTRLALRHLKTVPGALSCDLAGARTAAAWFEVVCGALDVTLGPRAALEDALDPIGHILATRGDLHVLLDNMEQLVEEAPRVLAHWRAMAPAVRFLVTSRERLRLHGEVVVEIEPLGLADDAPCDAVTLFHERARTACGTWEPTSADDRAIAQIVKRLDGFPLAIELAAARCRVLSPTELLTRLESGLGVLDRGPRDGAARHATLKRAISWSIDSLRPNERAALAQCSVFRGGFTATAAEAVIDVAGDDAPPALDLVQALADKSLVASRLCDGVRRFEIYASIREVSEAELRSEGDCAAAEVRHARYYVTLGEALAEHIGSETRRLLERERENLSVAHARSASREGLDELTARAALVLDDVLAWRGPLQTNFALLDASLASGERLAVGLRARVLEARGRSLDAMGRADEARADLELALALATEDRDQLTIARANSSLCVLSRKQRRYEDASAHGELALAACRDLGASRFEAFALGALGAIALERGDLANALTMMERVRVLARGHGDPWLEAMSLAYIGHAHHETSQLDQAAVSFDKAILMLEASGDHRSATVFAIYRAMVEHERGHLEAARVSYEHCRAAIAELGIVRFEGLCCACDGAAAAQLGDRIAALRAFDAARHLLERAGDPALQLALSIHGLHLERRTDGVASGALRDLITGSSLVRESDDVRFAIRILTRAIDGSAAGHEAAEMVVAHDGRWFQLPGTTERVSLFRNRALRRIMLALAEIRVQAPGDALGWEPLLAAGWPGERMLASAGAHRVRVAISTLRARGLRAVLQSRDDGYLLDPAIRVSLARPEN